MTEIKLTGAGGVLRRLREDADLTLRDFADRLGWNPGTVSKYENGKLGLTLETVDEIADALKIPRETIMLRVMEDRYASSKKRPAVRAAIESLLQVLAEPTTKSGGSGKRGNR